MVQMILALTVVTVLVYFTCWAVGNLSAADRWRFLVSAAWIVLVTVVSAGLLGAFVLVF